MIEHSEQKGAIEVVVRSAMLVEAGSPLNIQCRNETNPEVDSVYIRAKDFVGNTITLDITSAYKEALKKKGLRFQTKRTESFCKRIISKTLHVNLETFEIIGLERIV